jgi:hypothetical protein
MPVAETADGFGDCAPALEMLPCEGADSWSSAGIGSVLGWFVSGGTFCETRAAAPGAS